VVGKSLAHYRIVEKIGAGGMGEVYRASDSRLGRNVALKILPEAFAKDPERIARFQREAQVLAQLNHPNIASIYGLEKEGETFALALELVEGPTLADRIRSGPIPASEALPIARQIAEAMESAHESGIVHRDLKPANVKLTAEGKVKVLDFGLAKALAGDSTRSGSGEALDSPTVSPALTSPVITGALTGANVILGTAAYMSPEQARGKPADRRTDIWSFGVVLFEMLTGRMLFQGETVSDTLAAILRSDPDWDLLPAETPPRVRELLRRCLTHDASLRLRDIGEARIALADPTAGVPTGPAPTTEAPRSARTPWMIAAAAVLVAVLLALWPRDAGRDETALWLSVLVPPGDRIDAGPEFHVLTLSPDAKSVAYVARHEGTNRLYLRRLDEHTAKPLPGTEDARNPFFSPDGQWVAFFSGRRLLKVSVHGGQPVELAGAAGDRGGVWTETGEIVFAPTYGSSLVRMPDTGGEPRALTVLDSTAAERTHRWPGRVPGTEWIVFTVGVDSSPGNYDDADIEVVSLRTGERRKITTGAFARFAPGGHLVVGRAGFLYSVPFDPRDPRPAGSPTPRVEGVLGEPTSGAQFFDIADDGTLVFVPGEFNLDDSRLAWVDMDGRNTFLPHEPAAYRKMDISPDGSRALVEIGPGGGDESDIWLLGLEDGTMSRLTFDESSYDPVWTPDGRRFVLTQGGFLRIRSIDGSEEAREIAPVGEMIVISSVSPDGTILYFEYGAVNGDTWSVPIEGGEPRREIAGAHAQTDAVVSPDLRWIAYESSDEGESEIYVRPWHRPGPRAQISRNGGRLPMWAPDGKSLYFVSHAAMFRAPVAEQGDALRARTPERLFDVDANTDSSYRDVVMHPSGTKFLVRMSFEVNERREVVVRPGWATTLAEK